MTRLRTADIEHIPNGLKAYDERLLLATGSGLKAIALFATNVSEDDFEEMVKSLKICVIPMTCGQGAIGGFSDTVSEIITHLGFNSYVTQNSDAAGIAEAFEKKSDVIMLADDNRFVAINVHTKYVSDNSEMTARGFVAGLDLMAAGLKGETVLVLGCGEVGCHTVKVLVDMGVSVVVCDVDPGLALDLQKEIADVDSVTIQIDDSWNSWPGEYQYIIDATPTADLIDAAVITSDTFVAIPGVPCGLSLDAREKISNRYIHDPLQIGVATMVIDACKKNI